MNDWMDRVHELALSFDRLYALSAKITRATAENMAPACDGCGAPFGTGCSCVENKKHIGRGEREKSERE